MLKVNMNQHELFKRMSKITPAAINIENVYETVVTKTLPILCHLKGDYSVPAIKVI